MAEHDTNERESAGASRAKPVCHLIGGDGNVFAVIGSVRRALKNAGQVDRAKEFVARAYHAQCYEEVLAMLDEFVEVR